MSTVVLQQTPARDGQGSVWDYISPSRLNLWLRCPLAFKLRYIDGIRSPTSPSLFLGKVVHAGLETYYRHRQVKVGLAIKDVVASVDSGWGLVVDEEEMTFASTDEEAATRKKAIDLVTAYLRQVDVDESKPLAVETRLEAPLVDPFTGEGLGIPLLGIVDLVLSGDDGLVIIDFKTASKSGPPYEIIHEVQLSAYSYLFRMTSPQTEDALEIRSLVKTKVPKIEFHRYAARTDAHYRRLFRIVRAYLDDLDHGGFVHRPGFGCTMCDFRDGPCGAALA